ncbi:MAG: sigma-54-dependent Fis family transcriptional regulator [Spirochaetales bacterium]|nr:sigma-54-dependent Fis family transcriptional regulator [Spirochaetales bacterium]
MTEILLLEDDPAQRNALKEFIGLELPGLKVHEADSIAAARLLIRSRPDLSVIVSDLMLPDGQGTDLLAEKNEDTPLLILTAQPSIESAVLAIQAGASDYLSKPVDLRLFKDKLSHLVAHVSLKAENRRLRQRLGAVASSNFIGNSPAIQGIIKKIDQIAATDVTVLIEGESGTGKELVAGLIHESSQRAGKPFLKVNCGALTKSILESELFGVTRGAFTGADRDRAGYFEAANQGTLFLDEIGEMDMESQVRLLRVLEERVVTRLGSTQPVAVDVRIVAATNQKLLRIVDEHRFREDLYYRLAVVPVTLPPLRERVEDIPLLFNHFVIGFNEKYSKSVTTLTPDLLQFFKNYDWPGNIRQFRNVIEGMVVLTREDVLHREDLPAELLQVSPGSEKKLDSSILPGVSLEAYERAIIKKNLNVNNGNRERTAEQLGISERTLYRKIKEYDL